MGELDKSKLILRHDVDISLKRALTLARIEKDFRIRATYMVMTESSLYNIEDDVSRDILHRILDMGHKIGLHIEPCAHETESIGAAIDSACKQLKNVIGAPVLAFSFHRPTNKNLKDNRALMIGKRVNAYAEALTGPSMDRYLSDSKGQWKNGEPLPQLERFDKPLLQLLIHPIWWGGEHISREERLRAFVMEEARGKPLNYARALRDKIMKTIDVEFDL